MQIGIFEPDNFSERAIDQLNKIGHVSLFQSGDIKDFISDKEIIFIRLKYYIDKNLLERADKLQCICTPTTGLNHIDLEEVQKRNIRVVSLKGEQDFLSGIRATPEHIFGLTLSLLRNYKQVFTDFSSENAVWDRDRYRGREVYKNNVGIIGYGRVGKIIAGYFHHFGASVFFYDIDNDIRGDGVAIKTETIEDCISCSNIIILCASFTEDNEKFINSTYLDMMKDKYFINAARGELIDEDYLLEMICQDHFSGVALDVIRDESRENNRLDDFIDLSNKKNLLLTPHVGGATYESMWSTEEFITKKILDEIDHNNY